MLAFITTSAPRLVGELSTCSPEFRQLERPQRPPPRRGNQAFHHEAGGDLVLACESVDMISHPGLTLTIYAAEPASPTARYRS